MCMSEGQKVKVIQKMEKKEHLKIVIDHKNYAIFKDEEFDNWYFVLIDVNYNPLKFYDGSKESVVKVFQLYCETDKIFWDLLV